MPQRTEQGIMRNWKYMDPPLVSVCCITYNHEPYIRDAIEGFLMQETDFPFEVIIHDDASTDRTAEIVREYAELYPKIIKPIFQTENKYSKGIKILPIIVWPKAQGEFIALCEGDDYWTDPQKLQIQIEEMGKHPDCDISFHPATIEYVDNSSTSTTIGYYGINNCMLSPHQAVISAPSYCATASILVKSSILHSLPNWLAERAPVGDTFIRIYGAIRGGVLYINQFMSKTRRNVPGSWHERMKNTKQITQKSMKYQFCMKKIRKNLGPSFDNEIKKIQSDDKFSLALHNLKNKEYRKYKKNIKVSYVLYPHVNLKRKIAYWVTCSPLSIIIFAKLSSIYRFIKYKLQ